MALTPGTRVLMIPAGTQPDQRAYEHRPETWAELGAEQGVDLVLAEDHPDLAEVNGLGIWTVPEPAPDPVAPAPGLADAIAAALGDVEAPVSAADLAAVIADAVAPFVASP